MNIFSQSVTCFFFFNQISQVMSISWTRFQAVSWTRFLSLQKAAFAAEAFAADLNTDPTEGAKIRLPGGQGP